MPKKPEIPHEDIVKFILSGKTTADAQQHFGFSSDNVANLRVHAAFKALGIKRPIFKEVRKCSFCGREYVAQRRNRQTCGLEDCQNAFILQWQKLNTTLVKSAQKKFRQSDRGRIANKKQHAKKRLLGQTGTPQQKWAFAVDEISKSFRKLKSLDIRNAWEYRLQHIQKLCLMERQFVQKPLRNLKKGLEKSKSNQAAHYWLVGLRAAQTISIQNKSRQSLSIWEDACIRINQAVRTGEKVRQWKAKPSH